MFIMVPGLEANNKEKTKMLAMSKFYDLTANDLMNSFKFLDELDNYRTTDRDIRYKTTDSGLEFSVDLPGVRTEDLNVTTTGRELTIEGKLRERSFTKKFTISKNFDLTTARAKHEHGVLTLHFDRTVESKPNKIEIKINS